MALVAFNAFTLAATDRGARVESGTNKEIKKGETKKANPIAAITTEVKTTLGPGGVNKAVEDFTMVRLV